MAGAFGWGTLAASSLVIGALFALRFRISERRRVSNDMRWRCLRVSRWHDALAASEPPARGAGSPATRAQMPIVRRTVDA